MPDTDKDITDLTLFGEKTDDTIQRIKVIGVGGGGNNAVMHMHRQGIKDVSFVLLNTDKQVLNSYEIPTKILIGPGLGAGGKPEKARKYAEDDADKIAALFDDDTDMVFITAGMGGGTGTGAAPVVARIAKEKGILTVGIVTVPFTFESKRRVLKALEGAEEMAKNVDSLLIINNQLLTEIYPNMDILTAFAKADDTLLNAAKSITDIITFRGIINRDFNDVDTTLREGGSAIISTGYGEGNRRVTEAIKDALHSPLLKNTDIFGSKKILMVVWVSDQEDKYPFNMEETRELEEFVAGFNSDVEVMWGLYKQPGLDNKVRITILASGFDASTKPETTNDVNHRFPVPQPHTVDKTVESDLEPHVPKLKNGRILSPDSYDNPEDQTLLDIENNPAINRNPYKNYMSGFNDSRNFRGAAPNVSISTAKPREKSAPNDDDTDGKGATFIDFSDID
ncbi:MAG: cell division protein FtsZ [Muribaculaceae bacterium]|nr:cell division protein FtsZ [Muribaculaceae bacterium]